jgi:hypothetical protein
MKCQICGREPKYWRKSLTDNLVCLVCYYWAKRILDSYGNSEYWQ